MGDGLRRTDVDVGVPLTLDVVSDGKIGANGGGTRGEFFVSRTSLDPGTQGSPLIQAKYSSCALSSDFARVEGIHGVLEENLRAIVDAEANPSVSFSGNFPLKITLHATSHELVSQLRTFETPVKLCLKDLGGLGGGGGGDEYGTLVGEIGAVRGPTSFAVTRREHGQQGQQHEPQRIFYVTAPINISLGVRSEKPPHGARIRAYDADKAPCTSRAPSLSNFAAWQPIATCSQDGCEQRRTDAPPTTLSRVLSETISQTASSNEYALEWHKVRLTPSCSNHDSNSAQQRSRLESDRALLRRDRSYDPLLETTQALCERDIDYRVRVSDAVIFTRLNVMNAATSSDAQLQFRQQHVKLGYRALCAWGWELSPTKIRGRAKSVSPRSPRKTSVAMRFGFPHPSTRAPEAPR